MISGEPKAWMPGSSADMSGEGTGASEDEVCLTAVYRAVGRCGRLRGSKRGVQ